MSRRAEQRKERREAKLVIDNSEGSEGGREGGEGEIRARSLKPRPACLLGKVLEYSLLSLKITL